MPEKCKPGVKYKDFPSGPQKARQNYMVTKKPSYFWNDLGVPPEDKSERREIVRNFYESESKFFFVKVRGLERRRQRK